MANVRSPYFEIIYQGVDITNDIADDAISITFEDAVEGESSEIRVLIDDMNGRWKSEWQPAVGDRISLKMGYSNDDLLNCGDFEIDEVHFKGQPDTVEFRGLAIGVSNDLRTEKSRAFEMQTLRQVAQFICSENQITFNNVAANGSTPAPNSTASNVLTTGLQSTVNAANTQFSANRILDLTHRRLSQTRESDIRFLNRIGNRYGLSFNVWGNAMYPLLSHSLHNIDPMADCISSEFYRPFYGLMEASFEEMAVDKPIQDYLSRPTIEIKSYDLKMCLDKSPVGVDVRASDQLSGYSGVTTVENDLTYPEKLMQIIQDASTLNRLFPFMQKIEDDRKKRQEDYDFQRSAWRMRIYEDVENATQAEIVAMMSLYKVITSAVDGTIDIEGLTKAVAGSSVNVRGLNNLSGKYYITKARHRITRSQGYTTSLDVQLVGNSMNTTDA